MRARCERRNLQAALAAVALLLLLPACAPATAQIATDAPLPTLAPLAREDVSTTATQTNDYETNIDASQVLLAITLTRASGILLPFTEVANITAETTGESTVVEDTILPPDNTFAALALGARATAPAGEIVVNERVSASTTAQANLPAFLPRENVLAGLILYANGYEFDPHVLRVVDDSVSATPALVEMGEIPVENAFSALALGAKLPPGRAGALLARDTTLRAPSFSNITQTPDLPIEVAIAAVILGRIDTVPDPVNIVSNTFETNSVVGTEMDNTYPREDAFAALTLGAGRPVPATSGQT